MARYEALVVALRGQIGAAEQELSDLEESMTRRGAEMEELRERLREREEEADRDASNRAAIELMAQDFERTGAGLAAGLLGLLFMLAVHAATGRDEASLGQVGLGIAYAALAYGLVRASHAERVKRVSRRIDREGLRDV